ncbi:MAG: tripartite tricarboxylate transporter substrate binding protein [Betaproteobacteria bacterium]|nr:tripartite tricarboxylate transporter substrate binding protein [Betaproteobacteria bacterium]
MLRTTVKALMVMTALTLACDQAEAQWKPKQSVRIMVGYPAGGSGDLLCRLVAAALEPIFGQGVIVENNTGALGFIAAEQAARAKPDGHTAVFITMSMLTVAPYLPGNVVPIDIDKALTPIGVLADIPMIMVTYQNAPFNTVPELIALAKANPGKITFASGGVGSIAHIGGELINLVAGTQIVHVPYRGGPPATADLMAGRVDIQMGPLPDFVSGIAAKKLKPIALGSPQPVEHFPGLPFIKDTIPGFVAQNWYALMAPAGLDPQAQKGWNDALANVLSSPAVRKTLDERGFVPMTGQAAEMIALIKDGRGRWPKVIQDAKIKLN